MERTNRKGSVVGVMLALLLVAGCVLFARPARADGSPSPEPAPSVSAKALPSEPEPTNADVLKAINDVGTWTKQEIGGLRTDIKALKGDVSQLKGRMTKLEGRMSGATSGSSGSGSVGRPRRRKTPEPHHCSGPRSSEDECDGSGGRARSSACGCAPSAPPPPAPTRCAPRISSQLLAEIQRPVVEQASAFRRITFHCRGRTEFEVAEIPPDATITTAVIWHEARRRNQGPQFSHGHNMVGTMVCHHDSLKPGCSGCSSKNIKDGMRQAAWIQGAAGLTGIALYNFLLGGGGVETTVVRNVGGTTTTTTNRGRGGFGNP